ncbi:hypothetical protein Tco_1251835 [Tanacetum coccineum]
MFLTDFIPDERCVWIDWWVSLASGLQRVYKKLGVGGEAACLRIWTYRIIATEFAIGRPILIDGVVIQIPKNVNNVIRYRILVRVLREGMFVGWKVIWWDSFEEGEIRDDSVSGDCGNVTKKNPLMIMRMVTPVIASEKDSIIAPPSTHPGFGVIMATFKEAILLHNALSRQTKDAG